MPKGVYKKGKGYKVCEKPPKSKCYSKKPLPKKRAEAQFRAIMANSARESYVNKIDKLIKEYTTVNEQEEPIAIDKSILSDMIDKVSEVADATELFLNADELPIDPVYGTAEEYRKMLNAKLRRLNEDLQQILSGL